MLVFPAIDLLGGDAVRLEQGRRESAKIYADAPWEVAQRWSRHRRTAPARRRSRRRFRARQRRRRQQPRDHQEDRRGDQHGGRGGRRRAHARGLRAPVRPGRQLRRDSARRRSRTRRWSTRRARRWPQRIVVAVDAREGKVSVEGWTEDTDGRRRRGRLARRAAPARAPCSTPTSAATACARGPNLDATARLARRAGPVPGDRLGRRVAPRGSRRARCRPGADRGRHRQGALRRRVHRRAGAGARVRERASWSR